MRFDLAALENAIRHLAAGLDRARAEPRDELLRDGVIQRFEYTYELSHKMLKRYLSLTEASPESLDALSFPDLIRMGSERGLLRSGWDVWRGYRAATSHVYDASKARQVFGAIPEFLAEAESLLEALKRRPVSM